MRPALVRTQSLDDQRDDEVGGFGRGDAVIGGQAPVRDLADQCRHCEGHQPRRGGHHVAALLRRDDETLDVVDPPLVDAAELGVESLCLARKRPGRAISCSPGRRRRTRTWPATWPETAPRCSRNSTRSRPGRSRRGYGGNIPRPRSRPGTGHLWNRNTGTPTRRAALLLWPRRRSSYRESRCARTPSWPLR